MIDQGLLIDIAPYSCAYGHTMSNIISDYKTCTAKFEMTKADCDKQCSEFYERWIRSFLVVKNINTAKRLIEDDMGIKESELTSSSDIAYSEYKHLYREYTKILDEKVSELRESKSLKSRIEIRLEEIQRVYPESTLTVALRKCLDKKVLWGKVIFGSCIFALTLFTHNEGFYVRLWRQQGKGYSPVFMDVEIVTAINMFPELLTIKYGNKKEIY